VVSIVAVNGRKRVGRSDGKDFDGKRSSNDKKKGNNERIKSSKRLQSRR
jgi:hypothetical protein